MEFGPEPEEPGEDDGQRRDGQRGALSERNAERQTDEREHVHPQELIDVQVLHVRGELRVAHVRRVAEGGDERQRPERSQCGADHTDPERSTEGQTPPDLGRETDQHDDDRTDHHEDSDDHV